MADEPIIHEPIGCSARVELRGYRRQEVYRLVFAADSVPTVGDVIRVPFASERDLWEVATLNARGEISCIPWEG